MHSVPLSWPSLVAMSAPSSGAFGFFLRPSSSPARVMRSLAWSSSRITTRSKPLRRVRVSMSTPVNRVSMPFALLPGEMFSSGQTRTFLIGLSDFPGSPPTCASSSR